MTIMTEFTDLDPDEFHLVKEGASGFPGLLAKAAATVDEVGKDELKKARFDGFCGESKCLACKEQFSDFDTLVEKAKLKAKARNALPKSAFALPDSREYPIHDENHARAALSMLHNASPEQQSKIKAAVHRRYPDIGEGDAKKEGASQESHQDGGVSRPSDEQTRENHPHMGAVHMDVTREGFGTMHVAFEGHPAPTADGEGHGSTAPNKTLPLNEAKSQTRANSRKSFKEGDGRGDPAPDGDADDAKAESEAKTQTEHNARKSPGDAEWEKHDANLADEAGELIDELAQREKAEEKSPSASKESQAKAEAVALLVKSQAISVPEARRILGLPPQSVTTKEIEDMQVDELFKALDERDEARRAQKAERKAAEAKAEKKKMKMKEKANAKDEEAMAEKAKTDPVFAAKLEAKRVAKAAKQAAKAAPGAFEALAKSVLEGNELLQKMASQPQALPVLNQAGINAMGGVAALRAAASSETSVFKALDDKVTEAEKGNDPYELQKAVMNRSTEHAKVVERLHARGMPYPQAIAAVKASSGIS
jgi:hypothetical protein